MISLQSNPSRILVEDDDEGSGNDGDNDDDDGDWFFFFLYNGGLNHTYVYYLPDAGLPSHPAHVKLRLKRA